ncbi:MAG: phage major capsid protein [Proteobacteria bacterium]|nr:phage major capsid protein [Pseudomonadota bacterium]
MRTHFTDLTFARAVITLALADGGPGQFEPFAIKRWGAQGGLIAKAAVGGVTTADTGADPSTVWFERVFEASILGRLQGLRRVPWSVRMNSMVSGARGFWVGQLKPIPLSKPAVEGAELRIAKVASIVVATLESLQAGGQVAEEALDRDLRRAVTESLDAAFIDAGSSGIANTQPPSVTSGGILIPSVGDVDEDIRAAVDSFQGDLSRAVWTTDPKTAVAIGLSEDVTGGRKFPEVGARGGELAGIPVVTTTGSPLDSTGGQLSLIDPTGIAYNADRVEIERSMHGMLVMSDDPENDPSPLKVSMFQTESAALKSVVYANWDPQRAGGVVTITGAQYGGQVS